MEQGLNQDQYWMQAALKEAEKALKKKEVPVGVVVASRTRNLLEKSPLSMPIKVLLQFELLPVIMNWLRWIFKNTTGYRLFSYLIQTAHLKNAIILMAGLFLCLPTARVR